MQSDILRNRAENLILLLLHEGHNFCIFSTGKCDIMEKLQEFGAKEKIQGHMTRGEGSGKLKQIS